MKQLDNSCKAELKAYFKQLQLVIYGTACDCPKIWQCPFVDLKAVIIFPMAFSGAFSPSRKGNGNYINQNLGGQQIGIYYAKYNNSDCKFNSAFIIANYLVVFQAPKKRSGFFKPQLNSKWCVLLIFIIFYNFNFTQFVDAKTLAYIENSSSISGNAFAGIGAAAILPAFIVNFIANGIGEEILYRGFVKGIIIQAV